jgi:hypothetical protein
MKRLARWAFTVVSAASLALCGVSGAVWVRSGRVAQEVALGRQAWPPEPGARYCVECVHGRVYFAGSVYGRDWRPRGGFEVRTWALPPYGPSDAAWERRHLTVGFGVLDGPWAIGPEGHYTAVLLPHWFVTAALAAPPAAWLAAALRRRWRSARGLCRTCGYDLRASNGRCPECGTAIPPKP